MTKRVLQLACLLALTGCAHDNYTVAGGDPARMAPTLSGCKNQAIAAYIHDQGSHGGVITGAVLGGAVGGVIGAALDSTTRAPTGVQADDINPMIERCMAQSGFVGTSEN